MSYKIGIAGLANTGKSYSRRSIKDGENVFIISPSFKASHLQTSDGKPIKTFDMQTTTYSNLQEAVDKLHTGSLINLIKTWNSKVPPGTFLPENLKGNMQVVTDLTELPIWMEFISKHLTWIHTLVICDFTHFISHVISDDGFINRKAGGEAYQRFWELAAKALKNFVISIDKYREDLIVITEYHAEYKEEQGIYDIYVPAGKMLSEKFLIPSYYDILLFTDVKIENVGEESESSDYRFVTKPTRKYPFARAMNLWDDPYIPNDLASVLTKVRDYLGIPWSAPVFKKK